MNELINEGIIPMGFNFHAAKQQQNDIKGYNPFDPLQNPERIKHREQESDYQQQLAQKKMFSQQILLEINKSVNNLIKGNAKPNLTETQANLFYTSVENKVNEILNVNSMKIDCDTITEAFNMSLNILNNEYEMNVIRYKLTELKNVAFNENGMLMINPNSLYNIITNWCNANVSHQQINDIMING